MDEPRDSKKLADEILPITQWSQWWVGMWIVIAVGLLTSVFYMGVWHWLTLTLFAFGIPEFVGTLKQDDRYPPLTHIIVRYIDREIAFPLLFGFTGAALTGRVSAGNSPGEHAPLRRKGESSKILSDRRSASGKDRWNRPGVGFDHISGRALDDVSVARPSSSRARVSV